MIGSTTPVVQSKISDSLNDLTRQFIERSPFMLLATSSTDGTCDVSPRGDPAGFVHILDERTLLVPERPGNKLADSLRNVLDEPARRAAVPHPRRRRHAPRQRPRGADDRRDAARAPGGRGQDAEARAAGRGRRGLHALLEGVHPVGSLESGAAHRAQRAAEPGRDPPQPQLDRRRRPVRRRACRALRPSRGDLLSL